MLYSEDEHFIKKVAASDATVLIQGSTGTGKSYLARNIHQWSIRRSEVFVPINLATINENLLESELFGHEKGSFSGAFGKRVGRLELATGGTVFLDEIGELSLRSQVRLLEILNSKSIVPVGSNREIQLDVRVIVATNKNIKAMVEEGSFRRDLYYRLNTFTVEIPCLKGKVDRISSYAEKFLRDYELERRKDRALCSPSFLCYLHQHDWPGNLRELKNVMEYARIVCEDKDLEPSHLPGYFFSTEKSYTSNAKEFTLNFAKAKEDFEKQFLEQALYRFNGRINVTSKETKISKMTLIDKIRRYNINVEKIKYKNYEKKRKNAAL